MTLTPWGQVNIEKLQQFSLCLGNRGLWQTADKKSSHPDAVKVSSLAFVSYLQAFTERSRNPSVSKNWMHKNVFNFTYFYSYDLMKNSLEGNRKVSAKQELTNGAVAGLVSSMGASYLQLGAQKVMEQPQFKDLFRRSLVYTQRTGIEGVREHYYRSITRVGFPGLILGVAFSAIKLI